MSVFYIVLISFIISSFFLGLILVSLSSCVFRVSFFCLSYVVLVSLYRNSLFLVSLLSPSYLVIGSCLSRACLFLFSLLSTFLYPFVAVLPLPFLVKYTFSYIFIISLLSLSLSLFSLLSFSNFFVSFLSRSWPRLATSLSPSLIFFSRFFPFPFPFSLPFAKPVLYLFRFIFRLLYLPPPTHLFLFLCIFVFLAFRRPRDVKNTGALSGYTEHLTDPGRRDLVERVVEAFRSTVLTTSAHFRHGIIHVRNRRRSTLPSICTCCALKTFFNALAVGAINSTRLQLETGTILIGVGIGRDLLVGLFGPILIFFYKPRDTPAALFFFCQMTRTTIEVRGSTTLFF